MTKDPCRATSMRWRIAPLASFTWKLKPPNFSFICRTSNWRPVVCSNSATRGSKSPHSRHTMSNQPSPWVKPNRVVKVAPGVEPSGPSLDQLLLQCLMHSAATSGWQNARNRAQIRLSPEHLLNLPHDPFAARLQQWTRLSCSARNRKTSGDAS